MASISSQHDNPDSQTSGPMTGLRVVEFAGIGPGPFACMLLSDMGADVVTIDRVGKRPPDRYNLSARGRRYTQLDLKDPAAQAQVLELLDHADVLVEGYRPGVMERLGFGPDTVLARNPKLIYGRMTGWGQSGPLAERAGHDINYIALSGALHAIGPADAPVPPLNLVGDYGGGSLYLVVGILAALHEARRSGRGQVVDAAISDGAVSLMTLFVGMQQRQMFTEQRAANLLDGGAPFYGVYATRDAQHVSIGPIEPQFFAELCERMGVDPALRTAQNDRTRWGDLKTEFTRLFATRDRDDWTALLGDTDACYAPVLPLSEARQHPHNQARGNFVEVDGVTQPAPAPRFSRTPSAIQTDKTFEPVDFGAVLRGWR